MTRTIEQYRRSGRLGGPAFPVALGGTAVAAGLLAFPYQAAQDASRLQALHFALPVLFGLACGLLASVALRVAKVRHAVAAWGLVLVATAFGDAASFAWGYRAAAIRAFEAGEAHPTFAQWVEWRRKTGWLELRPEDRAIVEALRARGAPETPAGVPASPGWSPKTVGGAAVLAAWFFELVAMCAGAVVVARLRRPGPFCEDCREWAVPLPLRRTSGASTQSLRVAIRAGDVGPLLAPPRSDRAGVSARRVLHRCPRCEAGWLDVGYVAEGGGGGGAFGIGRWLARGVVLTAAQRAGLEDREDDVERRRSERPAPTPRGGRRSR